MKQASAVFAAIVVAACSREPGSPSVAPRTERVPLARVTISATAVPSSGGECRSVPLSEFLSRGWRAVALVFNDGDSTTRRILVAVDSGGAIRRYSDVQAGGPRIDVESGGRGRDGGLVVDPRARVMASGGFDEILDAPNLGRPRANAQLVLARCDSLLN